MSQEIDMLTTTLNAIRAHDPCIDGWQKLLSHLGKTQADDEPLPFEVILDSNGLDDALWCCRAAPQYAKEWRLYAVWCARQVQHLMSDQRSINALDVAERYAHGAATDEELAAACAAARDAAWYTAAEDAHWVAVLTVEFAAEFAAGEAAWSAALAALDDAGLGWFVTGSAERDAQIKRFRAVVRGM